MKTKEDELISQAIYDDLKISRRKIEKISTYSLLVSLFIFGIISYIEYKITNTNIAILIAMTLHASVICDHITHILSFNLMSKEVSIKNYKYIYLISLFLGLFLALISFKYLHSFIFFINVLVLSIYCLLLCIP